MGGFDKIEFTDKDKKESRSEESTKATVTSGKHTGSDFKSSLMDQKYGSFSMGKRKSGRSKFKFGKKSGIALLIIFVLLVLSGIPAYATYKSGLETYRNAKVLSQALKNQDIALASEAIAKTKESLTKTQKNFNYLIPYKFVPVIGWYYSDVQHLMEAGSHGLDTAATAVDALEPYADILGLKGEGSFTGGSAEERIRTAVMAASKITPQIDKIGASLALVNESMEKVDPNHYPTFIFGKQIKTQLTAIKQATADITTGINEAEPLVKALPSLLGESEAKKYLILFQNDKELRPTGGFITAYAIFRVDKGVIHIERSDDIYPLDDSISGKPAAPEALQTYLRVSRLNLRDSNLSPDFIESMETFNSLYNRAGQRVEVDGIIALDTDVLVKTIKILDDQVSAGGMTFTTKNDERCDCPQVIYELENDISRPVNYVKTDRKGIIGELLNNIMTKALSSSPKVYWGPLFQTLIAETNEKHILFYLYDEQAQKGIEALNAAGRIKDFQGDYLHINETNFAGAKVNIFMQEEVDNNYDIKGDGTIEKTVTIRYKNPFPASDCNLERGGLCLNAEYKDWIRIYVPKGSELIDSTGSSVKMTTYEDLGKTVFEGLVRVRPQGSATFTITYKLPFKWEGSTLPVLIQKQPGQDGNPYKLIVNGRTRESFDLLTDHETTLKK